MIISQSVFTTLFLSARFTDREFWCFRDALAAWTEKYAGHPLVPLRQAALTVRKFRGGIENARRYHRSNSPTEGLNKKKITVIFFLMLAFHHDFCTLLCYY